VLLLDYRQPHCRLTPPVQEILANICINIILPQTRDPNLQFCRRQYGSIFIHIFVVGSKRRMFCAIECVMAIQGHPRSLILSPIESAYVTSCKSLIIILVLSCTVSEILQLISRKTPIFPTPLSSNALA